jgi:WD40 repeat protein
MMFRIVLLCLACFFQLGCSQSSNEPFVDKEPIPMMISMSSDGRYLLEGLLNRELVLWDLSKHKARIISKNANVYSAYFIKNTPYFMWQALGFPYGHVYLREGVPSVNQLKQVAREQAVIFSVVGRDYFLYFPSREQPLGYSKKQLKASEQYPLINQRLALWISDADRQDAMLVPIENSDIALSLLHAAQVLGFNTHSLVHVQDVKGKTILSFLNFPVYGQVMSSDLKTYFAVDANWNVFKGYGKSQQPIMLAQDDFLAFGKLLTLNLSHNHKSLLSSGVGSLTEERPKGFAVLDHAVVLPYGLRSLALGVTLWDVKTGKLKQRLHGNKAKTVAVFSPDGRYIVSGDENGHAFIWQTNSLQRRQLEDVYSCDNDLKAEADLCYQQQAKDHITPPSVFFNKDVQDPERVVAIRFIDHDHFLRFTEGVPYALLYSVHSTVIKKYFPLGSVPLPQIFGVSCQRGFASAPRVHMLALTTAKNNGDIIEYHYDPKTFRLKKLWVGHLQSALSAH